MADSCMLVKQIKIGGRKAGLVGPEDAFAQVAAVGLETVAENNYIPRPAVVLY